MEQDVLEIIMHITRTRPQWGLVPLRIVFGFLIITHSIDLFSRKTLEGRLTFFSLSGWPLGAMIFVTALTEVCGLFLIPGLLSRLSGLVILLLASSSSVYQFIKFKTVLNLRFKLSIISMAILIVMSGAGKFSLDHKISVEIEKKYPNDKVHSYIHAETELPNTPWWW